MFTSRTLFLGGFLLCLSMLLIAGYFQFVEHLEPCPLCIIQRVLTLFAGVLFLIAAIHNPQGGGRKVYGLLITLTALLGVATSGRHVWLQSLPPDQVPSCGPGLNFILENFPLTQALQLVLRGSGECAEIVWTFLGLSIPAWTGIAFIVMALLGLKQLFAKPVRWNEIRG